MPLLHDSTNNTFELAGKEFTRITWYKDPALRKLYIFLLFAVLTSATNGYDGSMLNGIQALPSFISYFGDPASASGGSTLGLMVSFMAIGSIVAIPFVPYCADLLGRRMGIIIGCVFMILGGVLQSISSNLGMFIAGRFFLGFGVAIAHGAAPLLITELVHPQHRAVFTTIYNTTWYVGSIVASWLTYGTNYIDGGYSDWAWRIPTIGMLFPTVIQLVFIWFVPESPRWLISKGKIEQAHGVLARYHANGDLQNELVVLELQEIRDTIKLESEFESTSWMEFIRTKGNRHRLIILISAGFFSQWSGNGIISYFLPQVMKKAGFTDPFQQTLVNGILQIVNLIVAVTFCFFVEKAGRRKLFLYSTAGMLVTFIVSTICFQQAADFENHGAGLGLIVFIFLYYICYNAAWSGLLVGYTVEILPYHLRAKGMTIMFLCVDLSLWFNQYVNNIALQAISWKYYIVFDVWLAFELLIVYLFYIETKNTPLEEIAKHFDGDRALVGGNAATEKARQLADDIGLEGTPHAHNYTADHKEATIEHKEL